MAELVAKISADASQLVAETKKASGAFTKFKSNVQKETTAARNSLGQFTKGAQKDAAKTADAVEDIGDAFTQVSESIKKGNLKGALSGVAKGAKSAAVGLGGIGPQISAFSLLQRGASLALGAVQALAKGVVVLGVGLAGIGVKAASEFGRFESAFNQVRTLVDESLVDVSKLDGGVRKLATRFGVNLIESTKAAYQAISAGVEPGKVVEFLGTAFEGAAAGAATVSEVTDLLTSALNAFQRPASDAAAVSDVFFATIKAGKTTASELAASIGQVAPVASAASVTLEELGASLATLTASGLSTAEASTQVKAVLIELQKPSAQTAKLLAKIGVSASTIREVGLAETLGRIRTGAKTLGVQFTDLFSNTRAIQGATTLAGSNYDKFLAILKQTQGAAGQAAAAFEKTSKQLALSFGRLRAEVQNAFVQLGRVLAPALRPALDAVSSFVSKASADFDVLAEAARAQFGPSITKLFADINASSLASSTVVTSAVRAIGSALNSVGAFVARNADTFGVLSAVVKGVVEQFLIAANVTRAIFGGALFVILRPLALVGQALGRLLDLVPGLGGGFADAADTFAEFANTLGGEALGSLGDVIEGYQEIASLGDFADESAKSAKGAAAGLREFGNDALLLADNTDALRKKQKDQAAASDQQKGAITATGQAAAKAATQQESLAAATGAAATGARAAAGSMTQLERANAATLASIQSSSTALTQQSRALDLVRAASAKREGEAEASLKRAAALRAEFAALRDLTLFGEAARRATKLAKELSATKVAADALNASFEKQLAADRLAVAELEQFAAAAQLAESGSRKLAEGFGGIETSQQKAISTTRLLGDALRESTSRLNLGENLGGQEFGDVLDRAKSRVQAFALLLSGEAKTSFDTLAASFREGGLSAEEFLRKTESFTAPFTALREAVLQASNVLKGPFQTAADQLIVKLDKGKVTTAEFSREIQGLVDAQARATLGFTELFRSVDQASGSFQRLNDSAKIAKGALADQIRTEVQGLRLDLESGEITLDQYLEGLRRLGDESARFQSLSESQLVVVNQLREGNGALAAQVLELAGTLQGEVKTAFATYVEAFRQGQLDATELGAALALLVQQNVKVADSADKVAKGSERAADGLRDQAAAATSAAKASSTLNERLTRNTRGLADFLQTAAQGTPLESTLDGLDTAFNMGQLSASEYQGQLEQLFAAVQRGNQDFVGAAASGRIFGEQQGALIPKINELGRRLDEAGRAKLKVLIDGFTVGATTAGEFRKALQGLADAAGKAGRATAAAGQSLSVFGSAGGIQAQRRASGGSQLFGFAGTATGSSNYSSALEQQVGERLGLKPKALRSRAERTPGGLIALAEEAGVGRFASGGPVLSTGQATVEAGEHVLNNQGLNGLGRLIADLVNKGQGDQLQQTFNSEFNLSVGGGDGGVDTRQLAMQLAPELARMGSLAAARSPIT